MTLEPCVATIGALPATGADAPLLPLILAAALVAIGLGVLLASARGRRRVPAGAAAALALIAVVALATPAPAVAASPGSVAYTGDCTLLELGDVTVPPASAAADLLPGSTATVVSARVENPTAAPIRLVLDGAATGALGAELLLRTTIDGAESDAVDLAAGAAVEVALVATLPADAGNAAQGGTAATTLVLTATQR